LQLPLFISKLTIKDSEYCSMNFMACCRDVLAALVKEGCEDSQLCAAYSAGLLARLFCNPKVWTIGKGLCPRPVLVKFGDPSPGMLSVTNTAERWKYFELFWNIVNMKSSALLDATRSELIRSLSAIVRHASRQSMDSQAPTLPHILREHWRLLLQSKTPYLLRATLAEETGVLIADGSKVSLF
jgi:hypothetical protein